MKKLYLGGIHHNLFALVDNDDYDRLAKYSWFLHSKGYAVGHTNGHSIRMHRLVNNTLPGWSTDHINGDKLDNRRMNLRTCTDGQNKYNAHLRPDNTSGHKGVSWSKAARKWHAYINADGSRTYLGIFDNKEDAVDAYRRASLRLHGEFSNPI